MNIVYESTLLIAGGTIGIFLHIWFLKYREKQKIQDNIDIALDDESNSNTIIDQHNYQQQHHNNSNNNDTVHQNAMLHNNNLITNNADIPMKLSVDTYTTEINLVNHTHINIHENEITNELYINAYIQSKSRLLQILNRAPILYDIYRYWDVYLHNHDNMVKLYASKLKYKGIILKGDLYFPVVDPLQIYKWLLSHDLLLGFYGLSIYKVEILANCDHVIIKRIIVKLAEYYIEFIICTCIEYISNGSILILNTSLPSNDIYTYSDIYTRGNIHTSGFIIHSKPHQQQNHHSKQSNIIVEYALHIDLNLTMSKLTNQFQDDIIQNLLNSLQNIQNTSNKLPLYQPIKFVALLPDERDKIRSIAMNVVETLKLLFEASTEETWKVFYKQQGIRICELADQSVSKGFFQASCSIQAAPLAVRDILTHQAEAIDGFLDKKYTLASIDSDTIVQLLAYGPIWPVGARDYLIVTSDVSYPTPLGEGFIIASTSIDDICEEEDEVGHTTSKYTRSSMKLAGYVGVPNASGGTDLKLFVDIDIYSFVPNWLVQILAQYGLSEMMNRIRLLSIGQLVNRKEFQMDDYSELIRARALIQESLGAPHDGENTEDIKLIDGDDQNENITLNVTPTRRYSWEKNLGNVPTIPTMIRKTSWKNTKEEKALLVLEQAKHLHALYIKGTCAAGDDLLWKEKVNKQDIIVVASSVTGSDWLAIKATVTINTDAKTILKLVTDDSKTGLYDDMFDTFEFIAKVNDHTSIRRMRFKGIWPTAPRDFIVLTTWQEQPDGSILVSTKSAPDEYYPPKSDYVRGNIVVSGYRLKQKGKTCDVMLIAHTELGGTLPVSIINMLSATAPFKMLVAIRDITTRSTNRGE